VLGYRGRDGQDYTTTLRFDPRPAELTHECARFVLTLPPGCSVSIFLEVACGDPADDLPPRHAFLRGLRDARRDLRRAAAGAAEVSSSNNLFNEVVRRAVSDLYMLATETEHGRFPYAGVPWFSTVFGRDAIITAMQTLWLDPGIARGVLRHLAACQATEVDPEADAEPGKIIHEMRFGEMARLREVPFGCYYGSVDSTPLFVMLAGSYLLRTGDLGTLRSIWPNLAAALDWIATYGDRDGDGFVEYGRRTDEGLVNQGWKDSHDSISHADGTLAQGPVAIVEVQAYAYGAWRAGAAIARQLGHEALAADYGERAERLRDTFAERFFDEALGTFVLALDGNKDPCRVRSSNAGHALFTGIARPEHAAAVAHSLMQSDFFSGWGVRTLSSSEVRYNPMSYHNGSVWPHDNAMIAAGLARSGFRREAARIFAGLHDAAIHIDQRRLPELFCGFRRQRSQGPTFYPVACAPQAWAAGSILSMIQSCLGLDFDAEQGHVIFNEPILPGFIGDLTLRNLHLPQGEVDVVLTRVRTEVAAHVLRRAGRARVLTRA
jgi:glycogen debranching enzyme